MARLVNIQPVTTVIPVTLGENTSNTPANGIRAWDPDGIAQRQALTISFTHLPEGAVYDAQRGQLIWTPGPGQIGDTLVSATISDGLSTTTRTFTLRVVAEASANAPVISITSMPAQPGQTITATVRAQIRLSSNEPWQDVTLDVAGRLKFTPSQTGLRTTRHHHQRRRL